MRKEKGRGNVRKEKAVEVIEGSKVSRGDRWKGGELSRGGQRGR